MRSDAAWTSALTEHDEAIGALVDAIAQASPESWRQPYAPGKWSAAAEALHVTVSYEFGTVAATRGIGMERRLGRIGTWLSRWIVLPLVLRTGRFPRGAVAPREVRPDESEALAIGPDEMRMRLVRSATEASKTLRVADRLRPPVRLAHAYFGPIDALTALRLLSAHTRHHARRIVAHQSRG